VIKISIEVNGIMIFLKAKDTKFIAESLIIKVILKKARKTALVIINGINYNTMMGNSKITNYLDLVNMLQNNFNTKVLLKMDKKVDKVF
jgi:hypothetical protein